MYHSCLFQCKKTTDIGEVIGKYEFVNTSPNEKFKEYITILDSSTYIHQIINDTINYVDTARFIFTNSENGFNIYFDQFTPNQPLNTSGLIIPREKGFAICLPYIGVNDIRYKKIK